jgi:hypothetical protein
MILTGIADPDETQPGKPRSVPPPMLSIDEAPISTSRPRADLAPDTDRVPAPVSEPPTTDRRPA